MRKRVPRKKRPHRLGAPRARSEWAGGDKQAPTLWTPYHKGDGDYNPSPAYLLVIGGQFAEEIREPSQRGQRKVFHWRNIDFYRFSQCPQRLLSEGIEIVSPVTVAVDTSAQQRDCRN